jgi:GDP-mannose 6-dehydrogenase
VRHKQSEQQNHSTSIAVFGLGYVGCVTAACFAELGHRVVGVDVDEKKIQSIRKGRAPFYEPGLKELITKNRAAGRLSATGSTAEALAQSKVVFLCVGTPSALNGKPELEQLRRVSSDLAEALEGRTDPLIVAVRSTVPPGTCEEVVGQALGRFPTVSIVANPEFLREAAAVKDFLEPPLLVVGGEDPTAVAAVADLYCPLPVTACRVSLRTAEMIKYACNSFHAVKIAFANEIGTVCKRLDIPADEVMDTLCQDYKLNISKAYLKPGFAFGGSCLPKDLRTLNYRGRELNLELPLLASVLPSNAEHLQRAIRAALDLPARRIGVFGLAFKADTDDLRESPVVSLIEQLLDKGRQVRIYDPHIRLDHIYGSNRHYLLTALPHADKWMDTSLDLVLRWAEAVVTTQKPNATCLQKIVESGLPVLELSDSLP